jgi:hypothetical protein
MGRDALGIVTGLAVLVTGVIAMANLIDPADPVDSPEPNFPVVKAVSAEPIEGLPGVGPAVMRVLDWSGSADIAGVGELAQLPPSVAAVLTGYGTPLLMPTDSRETQ